MSLKRAHYIDTRKAMFASDAADYPRWLGETYQQGREAAKAAGGGHHGLAQVLNAALVAGESDAEILAYGPHAGAVAKFVESLADGQFTVSVLGRIGA